MSANFLLPLICIRSLQGIVGEVWRGKGRGRGGGERKKRRRHESVYKKEDRKKKRKKKKGMILGNAAVAAVFHLMLAVNI